MIFFWIFGKENIFCTKSQTVKNLTGQRLERRKKGKQFGQLRNPAQKQHFPNEGAPAEGNLFPKSLLPDGVAGLGEVGEDICSNRQNPFGYIDAPTKWEYCGY